jgi:Cu/Ag efflux protein CusF
MEVEMKKISTSATALLCLLLATSLAAQTKTPPAGKKQFVFKGKVEKVDAANKSLSVKNENVEGWMPSMTMSYSPDKEDVLKKIKAGDDITAKVYDGDFRTLYDIQVVTKPADAKPAPAAAKSEQKGSKK